MRVSLYLFLKCINISRNIQLVRTKECAYPMHGRFFLGDGGLFTVMGLLGGGMGGGCIGACLVWCM